MTPREMDQLGMAWAGGSDDVVRISDKDLLMEGPVIFERMLPFYLFPFGKTARKSEANRCLIVTPIRKQHKGQSQ